MNMLDQWTQALNASFQNISQSLIEFVPTLIIAIAIFIIGWVIGSGLGRVVAQVIKSLKVDNALKSAGLEDLVHRAGFTLDAGKFLGGLVQWFVIIVFLVASLQLVGLTQVNEFLSLVVLRYIPQVIVAVAILLAAAVLAEVVQGIVSGAARAANVSSAGFAGNVAKWAIWIFAILAALDHLAVLQSFVQTLFTGIVVAVSIAVGLAFGLGGQHAAANYIEKVRKEIGDKN